MEKKMIKKLLAVMMIITILAADFFTLGSSLITYATQVTNEIEGYPNIHFSTYFKEGENEIKQINKSIKDRELKLYAKIGVNSDVDCLEDIEIKLNDNNFNIISSNKGTVEGNTVKLDYIAAGSLAEFELNIEPVFANKISADMLLKTEIELNAKYKYADAPKGEDIQATSKAIVKYVPDENTRAELEAEIITNKVFAISGTNKRIIQALIKSKLTNNEYPVKQTTLNVSIPNLGEIVPEISVLAISKLATNGQTEIKNMTTEDGNVQITIDNEVDENNQVSWIKNAFDEIIVTYIYPETVDASKVEITANSEIKLYGSENTYTATHTKGIENQGPNHVIMGKSEIITEELYKGNLYAKTEEQYNTKMSIIITNVDVADQIVVYEGLDAFGIDERELEANTKYISTEINLENILDILGQDGSLEIKNGEASTIINKNTEVNESGNVVINYENGTNSLTITTSKPVKSGVLELEHKKAIYGDNYTREELQTIKTINVKNAFSATLDGKRIVGVISKPVTLELKETISKAELTIDRTALSATEVNEVILGIKLITDGAKYDLYKDPSITIKFPETVANVEFVDEPKMLYSNELEITYKNYDPTTHTITINTLGEQTKYPESSVTQSYIPLKLKVTVTQFAISQTDKIIMTYTNKNATQYVSGIANGIVEQPIKISAPSELIKMFNISSNENTSITEKILQQTKTEDAGKEFDFDIVLINNKDTDMSNIEILGKLPTTGNTVSGEINTLETKLKNIVTENATIYYTTNSNATEDIENSTNGWTESLTEDAKLYLIKLDSLVRGAKFTATVTIEMSNPITENAISFTEYEVIYDTELNTKVKENSRIIGLSSSLTASIKLETTAQVGRDILKSGDPVKEGEVIKYTVTAKNNGTETLENVKLNLDIPEGTVLVQPIERYVFGEGTEEETVIENGGYVYADGTYYEEITDTEKIAELTDITIPELTISTPYAIEYEVRVKEGTANNEISNKVVVTYNETSKEAQEIKNRVEESNIRVTIKRAIDISEQLYPNGYSQYVVYVENLSNSTIKDLELKIVCQGFEPRITTTSNKQTEISEKIKINKIEPKDKDGIIAIDVHGKIDKDIEEMNICAIVNDSKGNAYRSNLVTEKLPHVDVTVSMSSPQNGAFLKEGDKVEYNAIIKNTSDIENVIQIQDIISEHLEVEEIYINKTLINNMFISNDINYTIILKQQEQASVDIIAKVGYIPELYHGKVITNMITISAQGVIEANSEIVTHTLKSSERLDDKLDNVISGFVWFDTNGDGKKDNDEKILSGISVKLYDTIANHYITDEYGNAVEITTGNNGEYVFTKIPTSSYLMIFEYNNEKYEFEINKLTGNIFDLNVGLKESNKVDSSEDQGTSPEDTEKPTNPEETPVLPEKPEEGANLKTLSGFAWLDSNRNGQKENDETLLAGIKVKIYDVKAQKYLVETVTDEHGQYEFKDIESGSYVLIFEYDKEKYEPTIYMAEGVNSANTSKVVLNNININGQEIIAAVTDTIDLQDDISNINIGLKENLIFDLELNKYISKIVVQTSQKTKQYDYKDNTFAKVEINKKQLQGATVVLEYTMKVKNTGEISGYARNIVDYLPSGLTFSSELNKDWYLLDSCLYTKNLENVEIKPGEEKEVKLILTKTMTNSNVGLINNRAEIYEDYNKYGEDDIDSRPNNQEPNEDDFGSIDTIIQVSTGGRDIAYTILFITNVILIGIAMELIFKRRIIKIPNKKWRK